MKQQSLALSATEMRNSNGNSKNNEAEYIFLGWYWGHIFGIDIMTWQFVNAEVIYDGSKAYVIRGHP